jgi:hypothetical protein
MQTAATITTRSRNLGYGWSTDRLPDKPDHVGTVKTMRRAMVERARLIGPGTYYYDRLFVGGVPVRAQWGTYIHEILNDLDAAGSAIVTLNPVLRSSEIGELLGISRQSVLVWYEADKLPGAWRQGRGREVRMYRDDALKLRTASGHVCEHYPRAGRRQTDGSVGATRRGAARHRVPVRGDDTGGDCRASLGNH